MDTQYGLHYECAHPHCIKERLRLRRRHRQQRQRPLLRGQLLRLPHDELQWPLQPRLVELLLDLIREVVAGRNPGGLIRRRRRLLGTASLCAAAMCR